MNPLAMMFKQWAMQVREPEGSASGEGVLGPGWGISRMARRFLSQGSKEKSVTPFRIAEHQAYQVSVGGIHQAFQKCKWAPKTLQST